MTSCESHKKKEDALASSLWKILLKSFCRKGSHTQCVREKTGSYTHTLREWQRGRVLRFEIQQATSNASAVQRSESKLRDVTGNGWPDWRASLAFWALLGSLSSVSCRFSCYFSLATNEQNDETSSANNETCTRCVCTECNIINVFCVVSSVSRLYADEQSVWMYVCCNNCVANNCSLTRKCKKDG